VHGRRVQMRPRDVIVTPTWNFHDHGKKGAGEEGGDNGPVIWLDGLDLPNFIHFPVHFVEHFAEKRYPAVDAFDSPVVYPWEKMHAKLEAAEGAWASVPYLKEDGRESEYMEHRLSRSSPTAKPWGSILMTMETRLI
jgi:gentisate 1,2-dioxygenase